jgi:hypothetical protein
MGPAEKVTAELDTAEDTGTGAFAGKRSPPW